VRDFHSAFGSAFFIACELTTGARGASRRDAPPPARPRLTPPPVCGKI